MQLARVKLLLRDFLLIWDPKSKNSIFETVVHVIFGIYFLRTRTWGPLPDRKLILGTTFANWGPFRFGKLFLGPTFANISPFPVRQALFGIYFYRLQPVCSNSSPIWDPKWNIWAHVSRILWKMLHNRQLHFINASSSIVTFGRETYLWRRNSTSWVIFLNKCPLQIFNTVLHPILIHMKTAFPSGYHSDVSALEKTGSPSHISSESSSCMLFFSFPGHPSVHFRNHDILYSNSNFKGGNNHAQESSSIPSLSFSGIPLVRTRMQRTGCTCKWSRCLLHAAWHLFAKRVSSLLLWPPIYEMPWSLPDTNDTFRQTCKPHVSVYESKNSINLRSKQIMDDVSFQTPPTNFARERLLTPRLLHNQLQRWLKFFVIPFWK